MRCHSQTRWIGELKPSHRFPGIRRTRQRAADIRGLYRMVPSALATTASTTRVRRSAHISQGMDPGYASLAGAPDAFRGTGIFRIEAKGIHGGRFGSIFLSTVALASSIGPAHAHPGEHTHMSLVSLAQHLAEPDHLALLALVVIVSGLAYRFSRRNAAKVKARLPVRAPRKDAP
jgi:hypothetical protein